MNNKKTTTKTRTAHNSLKTTLNKAYRTIRWNTTSKYMTKIDLVTDLVANSGCSERTAYRYISNLENNNKLKTVSLYKIK